MAEVEHTVRRCLGGNRDAFDDLVRQWEPKVFNLAWRYLGNREDAQDVAQETFLLVFQSLRKLRDPKSFPTWIYRIALNQCRGRLRSRSSGDVSLSEPISTIDGEPEGPSLLDLMGGHSVDALETIDLIRKSLAGISEEHRTAILLKEYLGLNLEEVAKVMDCPLSTAKSRLYHGLRGVQRNLKRLVSAKK